MAVDTKVVTRTLIGAVLYKRRTILFGGVLAPLLVMTGLNRAPASVSSLLLNLEAVFTAIIAWVVFSENVDRRIFLGMLSIVAGGALLSWTGRPSWGGTLGPLLIALGCLSWGIDNNLSQKVSARDPVQIASIKGLAGTLMAVGTWLHLRERHSHLHVHEPITHAHRHVHDEHHQHEHAPGQDTTEPHSHEHTHERLIHAHEHYPDIHHRHSHDE